MKESNIVGLSREKSLLSYCIKAFKKNMGSLGHSNSGSWVYLNPEFDFAMEALPANRPGHDRVACFFLAFDKDGSTWLLNNYNRFEEVLSQFGRLVFCIDPLQFTELKSFLKNTNFGKINPEFQIVLDTIVTETDSQKRLPAQSLLLIKEAIILSKGLANAYFTFKTTEENCFWADDINNLFLDADQSRIFFYPSAKFFLKEDGGDSPIKRETAFHLLMFYDNLARQKSISLSNRLFYKRLVGILERKSTYDWFGGSKTAGLKTWKAGNGLTASNFPLNQNGTLLTWDLLFADFEPVFMPRIPELFNLSGNLLKGKLNKIFKGAEPYKIQNSHSSSPQKTSPLDWKHVLITGWYGTETQGDKAIIGEVLHFIKSCSPACKISLTTIYDKISIQTNFELKGLEGVHLISIYEKDFSEHIWDADAVIMGGGPIMETAEMINVLRIFEEANNQNKARIIFGCGIGPFHTQRIIDVTKRVLELTTAGFVRDKESWEYAGKLYPKHVLKFACDPAVAFVYRWKNDYIKRKGSLPNREFKIAGLLRANTNEFAAGKSSSQLEEINRASAKQIGDFLEPVCKELNCYAELLHMNAPWVGGDDRMFNRLVEEQFPDENSIGNERRYLELDDHIERMLQSEVALAMRYHGHIFCLALGIPFVSIDYTGKKGKVSSLVNRIGYAQWSEEWSEMQSERAADRLKKLVKERDQISLYLNREAEQLVALLYQTYAEVFDVTLKY